MRRPVLAAAAAACAFVLGLKAASAQPVTPEMFGALPTVSEAVISPDGKTIAALQSLGGVQAVLFYDADNPGTQPKGVRLGAVKARSIVWANETVLLLLVSQAQSLSTSTGQRTLEMHRWNAISKSTMKPTQLFRNEGNYYIADPGRLLATLPGDRNRAVFARWSARARTVQGDIDTRLGRDEGTGYSLQSVRLDTGLATIIASGDDSTVDWLADEAGEAVARVDYDQAKRERRIFARKEGSKRLDRVASLTEPAGRPSFQLQGLSAAPGTALATAYVSDRRSLVAFDLEAGALGSTVYSHPRYDIDGVIYDPHTARVGGAYYTDDLRRAFHLDASIQRLQDNLAAALDGGAPLIESRSADDSRMIVRVTFTNHADQIFFFDRPAGKLNFLAPTHAALDGEIFAAKEKYDYVSSDGLAIAGYLTVPAGATRAAMPLIVLPHGGPWARDDQAFDYWSFFYAARGYLVYQPNFRGSTGYGGAFRDAGDGEWGRKMQDDITEGVKNLIADGLVDEKRICIVGASYGGYAALAGATLTPDLYACAVSVNGVTNLPDLIGAGASKSTVDFWEARVGSRRRDIESLRAVSPVYQAHRAKAPILLIHGRDDTVVSIGQSRVMAKALADAGKPHEFVELKGEDHWLSNGETRTEMLRRSIAFIDRHIGANAKAGAP